MFMGSPRQVGAFCAERRVPFDCLADPDRSAYRAFGLASAGPGRWLLNPRVIGGSLRLFRRGIAGGLPHPGQDVRQMPGTFVVAAGGTVRLAHYNTDSSDNAPVEAVLGALGG